MATRENGKGRPFAGRGSESREPAERGPSRWALAAAVAGALAIFATLAMSFWLNGMFLPSWVSWSDAEIVADLDGADAAEQLVLADRRLVISDGSGIRYRSPDEWFTSDVFVGDMTRDGTLEIVTITWKRGSFGTGKPFWIERDSPDFSQHVFVFDYIDGDLQPVWMSSALSFDIRAATFDGQARLHLQDADGEQTTWAWGSWGLVLVEDAHGDQAKADAQSENAGGNSAQLGNTVTSSAGGAAGSGDAASDGDPSKICSLTMLAAGDVIVHDSMLREAERADNDFDFTPLFTQVKSRIESYDVAVVGEETPLVSNPARFGGYPSFGTPTDLGDALAHAGFDVVLGASNHADDQGETGVSDTVSYWRERHPDIALLGLHDQPGDAGSASIVDANGIRLALFDYTFALNGHGLAAERAYEIDVLGEEQLIADVADMQGSVDATVCFLHIGEEYADGPTAEQRSLCEQLVEAGADAVICSHPHVLQPVELLQAANGKTGVVFWSLGNFASNQTDPATVLGGAASLTFTKTAGETRVESFELLGTVCHFEPGLTEVFWLDDYTDELAARHRVNALDPLRPITYEALRQRATSLGCANT